MRPLFASWRKYHRQMVIQGRRWLLRETTIYFESWRFWQPPALKHRPSIQSLTAVSTTHLWCLNTSVNDLMDNISPRKTTRNIFAMYAWIFERISLILVVASVGLLLASDSHFLSVIFPFCHLLMTTNVNPYAYNDSNIMLIMMKTCWIASVDVKFGAALKVSMTWSARYIPDATTWR